MRKIQLTLTDQEAEVLSIRAAQVGYNLTRYVKLLLGREVVDTMEENDVPVFRMSSRAEALATKGLEEYCAGRAKKLKGLDGLDKV